jgi:hypothetical protein
LTWWNEEALRQNGLPIREVEMNATLPKMTIFTDASDLGWGIKSETLETSGHWTPEERSQSINVRELKTILFALQLHAKSAQNSHINLFTDSITALKYVKKQGGTSSPTLQRLALQIHELLIQWNISIHYGHIPENTECRSRPTEQAISSTVRTDGPEEILPIVERWGPRSLEAFGLFEPTNSFQDHLRGLHVNAAQGFYHLISGRRKNR